MNFLENLLMSMCMASHFTIYKGMKITYIIYKISYIGYKISELPNYRRYRICYIRYLI